MNMQILQKLIKPTQIWERVTIVLAVTLLYIVVFKPLVTFVGPVSGALITIPVVATGWFFGPKAGFFAGLASIALNGFLSFLLDGVPGTIWLLAEAWPGNFMAVAAGYGVGLLRKELSKREQIGDELYSRERFITLMGLATRDILNPKIPENKYYYLANHLANIFVADYAYLISWDSAQGQMTLLISTKPLKKPFLNIALEPEKAGSTAQLLGKKQALVIGVEPSLSLIIDLATLTKLPLPAQSELAIPLTAGEYKFGVVILGFEGPRTFSGADLIYAQLVASQITLSLWTDERDNLIKKQLRESDALAKIERALSETERVGLETVLQLIVDSTKELIRDAEQVVLHMLDDEKLFLVPRAVAGVDDRATKRLNMRLREGIAGQVVAEGGVIAIPDTQADPRFSGQVPSVKFRSLIVAPIGSNERRVGTISIASDRPYAFTVDDSRLLGALGTQAAIAIENARLLEITRQKLKEANALFRINQDLITTINADELMQNVADLLQESFGYYYVQIFVAEPSTGDFVVCAGSGALGREFKSKGYRLPAGEGIVGFTAETGKPFFTNDVDDVISFVRAPFLPETKSELAVPIKVDSEFLGLIDVYQIAPGFLTENDLQLVSAVADQLALALQKANLYNDLQESLSHEKAIRSHLIHVEKLTASGRLLASVSHELNNPIQAIQNALFLLKEEKGISPQGKQDLEIVLSEAERMASMLQRLRTTYQPASIEDFKPVQLNDVIEDVCALVGTHLRHNQIAYEFFADSDLPMVPGLQDQLKQVVLNLLMNAVDAMPSGGCLTIATQHLTETRQALISVSDTGPGIEKTILPNIFDAFVTNKELGTGLGLTISHEIIQRHGGRLVAENNPERGATFRIWLPLGEGQAP